MRNGLAQQGIATPACFCERDRLCRNFYGGTFQKPAGVLV